MKFRYLLITFLALTISSSSKDIHFEHLDGDDGLLSNTVNAILQDSEGFMWFGTKDGLSRYDGYSFLNFTHSPLTDLSLSNNYINDLVEDQHKNIWIANMNGLNVLNRKTYEIERIPLDFDDSLGSLPINSLELQGDSILWIGASYNGLYKLNINTQQQTHYPHSASSSFILNSNYISSLLYVEGEGLLVGSDGGLDIFDPKAQTYTKLIADTTVSSLNFYNDSSVFVGLSAVASYYCKWHTDGEIEHIELPSYVPNSETRSLIDSTGSQWITIRDAGLLYAKTADLDFTYIQSDRFKPDGLSSNAISASYLDSWGNVWIGTVDAGLNIYSRSRKAFGLVKDNYLDTGLRNNRVRAMYQDSEGDIWIGTKIGGTLSKFNREELSFTHYASVESDPTTLSDDVILCITEYKPGYLWVSTLNGLNLFDKKTGKVKRFFNNPINPNSISSNINYDLLQDGNLLYVGGNSGLDVFDTEHSKLRRVFHSDSISNISSEIIRVVYKDKAEHIWIGTINGLNFFDVENGTFTSFVNHANDSNSISSNIIQCIHEDQNEKLWIGTIMGLNLMNRETNTFTSFSTQDGLPGNSINAIQEDEEGNLWISTNNGIAKFNTQNFTSKNYTKEDGLQGNEFSSYVSCKTKEGEILFGGDNGFTIFKPQDIQDNKTLPKVVITDFKLFNQPVVINGEGSPLTQHISQTKEITLTHKQSVFSFEFVALSNVSPEKNHYAYMLEGFDDDWNEVGKKRDASYTNLNAGTYYFKVRASNNDGFLSEEGAQLKITILPPPWLSWWAYSFYVLLIIGLLLSVWLYTIKRIKEGEEHKKNEQNLRFFMNVSHEFRTPLTLILHPLNKLLSFDNPEVQAAAKTIQLSSSKLLNLVNQLLDYRRMDLGKRPLKAVKTDIVAFTKNIFTLFTGLGEVKNIKFRFVCQAPEIEVWFDVDKYEKILNNLLSNAIKFTPAGGEVEVSIAKLTSKGHTNEVEIRVKDSGIGLDAKQAKHVFERFYSDDKSKTGTGIGLNYTKSLVELHKGKIFVESTLSVGSTFIVRLPLGASHLKKRKSDDEVFNLDNFQHQMHQLDALKYDIQTTDEEDVHISEGEESTNRRKSKKPLLLIVEDNKKLRTQLREQLARTYTVSEAINGLKGWEMALKTIPDLIISDVMMPEMDGIELCQKLKNTSRTSHIPVILLTAQSTDSHKIQGYDSGADQYISKPFNYEVLESRIKSLLIQRKRLHNIFRKQIEVTPSDITATTIDEQMIQKALDFVEKHISNSELSVEDLSAELQVTRGHLYRKLMSITGKSPSDFIRSIRLKRAAQLLRSSRLTVSEIAYKVGFSNPKYFSKCFKVEFDLTPSKYASKKHED